MAAELQQWYIYIFMKSFLATISELGIDIGNSFCLDWRLPCFGKELVIIVRVASNAGNSRGMGGGSPINFLPADL